MKRGSLEGISRFSPGNCDPAFLESITVGREDLLGRLERSVASSVRSGAGHHWLIVGPRGAGKTHLLALLRDHVDRDETLRDQVVIAYMKEEERGVTHYLDWLVRILQSFVRHAEPGPDVAEELEQILDMRPEAARSAAEQLLLRFVGKRRLLLLAENLGEVFSRKQGMGREGQQRFRDLIQQHPFWTIVATSQALFADIRTRDVPFYGFFKVRHLEPLDLDQSMSLLERLARAEHRSGLETFLRTPVARGRVRAVHRLTCGNPRLLVIFYQCIDSESLEDLASSFLSMVDNLTSYYQERMQILSPAKQRIIELLCSHRKPVTVANIARHCFMSHQTASSELKRLTDLRYVHSIRQGRSSYYELSEPLFRICFEVKENRSYPVRLFVDFLGTFYSIEELQREYRGARLLELMYRTHGQNGALRKEQQRIAYLHEAAVRHHWTELHAPDIDALIERADYREATTSSRATEGQPDDAAAWHRMGRLCLLRGQWDEAIRWCEHAIAQKPGIGAPYIDIMGAYLLSERYDDSMDALARAFRHSSSQPWVDQLVLHLGELNAVLLLLASLDKLPELLDRERSIIEAAGHETIFSNILDSALISLLQRHDLVPLDRLQTLATNIVPRLAEHDDLAVACRLFNTGTRYLKERDLRILLELPLEERELLERLLATSESPA